MWWKKSARPFIECTRLSSTSNRPRSEGTYIVRLSLANKQQLRARNGAYLKVSYGNASVLASLSVDKELDDETIRMDQTLRTAICLEKVMGEEELVYRPGAKGSLENKILIERSSFPGPTLLARLVKQQYLICVVHHAIPRDMETPLARLTKQSMQVIGIQPGDKVLLISSSEKKWKRLRCLPLEEEGEELPLPTMRKYFHSPCPKEWYRDLHLPWITMDKQSRLTLDARPWHSIIVGRDPRHAIASELSEVVLAVALAAVGGSFVVPSDGFQIPMLNFAMTGAQASFAILSIGFLLVLTFIWLKIRSRI